jgi:drug/metabolite transporter (DMT)-like permease
LIQNNVGEWAALATALCWTITAMSFEKASKRVGSLPVNLIRLILAMVLFSIYMWIKTGSPIPLDASKHQWFYLTLSGFIGFVMGDLLLFRAFVEIGSRVAMLIMASVPVWVAIMGWIWLNEQLALMDIFGMAMTISGIVMVILDRGKKTNQWALTHSIKGVVLALGGAMGQAVGLILSKVGMGDYDPFAATQIRVLAGIIGFSLLFFPLRRWTHVRNAFHHSRSMFLISIGAVFGPFLGVSLSLMAIQKTMTGVASTIMAIVPILLIPPAIFFLNERVTIKEIAGAFIAVGGVAFLFLT